MVRISKQEERRNKSPRRRRVPGEKTGPKKDQLPLGYKEHRNCSGENMQSVCFIPEIR